MHSLRAKMNLAICALCMICICITAFISYENAAGKLNNAQEENAQLSAERSALEINAWLQEQGVFLDTTATSIETNGNTETDYLHGYLGAMLNAYNQDNALYDIYYTSSENVMSSGTDYVQAAGIDFTTRSWYTGALHTDGIYYSSPDLDVDTGRTVITISRKIELGGNTAGVLAEDIFLDEVINMVNQSTVPKNSYAMLLDQDQTLMVHPNEEYASSQLANISGTPYAALTDALATGSANEVTVQDYDGTERTVFTAPIASANWTLGIAADTAVLHQDTAALVKGFRSAAIISLIISILITTIITARIVGPIKKLTRAVVSRDLSHTVNVRRKDEIGKLANGFNDMMYSLRGLLETSSEAVHRIQESSDTLKSINTEVVGGAHHVKDNMDHIASSMETQSHSVEYGQNSLQQFHGTLTQVQDQFRDMHDVVQNICDEVATNAAVAKQLKSSTDESKESIHKLQEVVAVLEEKSRHITEIVSTIQQITSQTQLLAVNASIEAGRAGDAGRGFAVVAKQIRNLSDQTDESSENISLLLSEVQKQIEETVHGLDTVAGMFEQNSCVAGEVHDVFDTIEKSIRDIVTEDRELSQELQGFMAAELDITNSFADVNKNAADCSSYSEQALQISAQQTKSVAALKDFVEQLDTMSTELTAKIENFKL